jgi:hypothetical protein
MSTQPSGEPALVVHGPAVILHMALWLFLLLGVFVIIPWYSHALGAFAVDPSAITRTFFTVLNPVVGLVLFNPFVLSLPLGLDITAVVVLRRSPRTRVKRQLWLWLMIVFPALVLGWMGLALLPPLYAL